MNSDMRPLAELKTLDRDLLHVFVAGPGVGEGIAIALPGAGWALLDGCRVPRGGGLTIAVDGTTMAWSESKASLTVHAPAKGAHLDQILDELANGNRAHANEASVVAQVSFGDTRVLLGGDLPRVRSTNHKRSIPTGWDSVMVAHPGHAGATGLKLPHHGSAGAFHSGLMKQGDGAWVVTPYDSSRLPRLEDGGLPDLLKRNPRVYLSRLGSAMAVTRGTDLRDVPLKALRGRVKANPTGDPFLDTVGYDIRTARCEPRGPIWAFAFDDHGGAVRQWFGEEAVLVRR